jgi:hypothetical protein
MKKGMKVVYRLRLTTFLATARLTAFRTTALLIVFLTAPFLMLFLLRERAAFLAALLRLRLAAILAASAASLAKFLFLVRAAFLAASILLALEIAIHSYNFHCGYMDKVIHSCFNAYKI